MYKERQEIYKAIEQSRNSKVIAYSTSNRPGMETQIASDAVDVILEHLDSFNKTDKISLILYTLGGNTLAAWNIINLIREFCKELEILVPNKCRSAGTLMCLGADNIIMTKQATLGPIDPSLISPYNPIIPNTNPPQKAPVSVESVKGYFDLLKEEVGVSDPVVLGDAYKKLVDHINPLVLGDIYRSKRQIQMLARKMMEMHRMEDVYVEKIIKFLCSDSGSHDYTISRTEAKSLGLKISSPDNDMYALLKKWYNNVVLELRINEGINPEKELNGASTADFVYCRGLIESVAMRHAFVTEGSYITKQINNNTPQKQLNTIIKYEGWKSYVD